MYVVKKQFYAGGRTWKPKETLEDSDAKALLGFGTLVDKGKLALVEEPVAPQEETKGKQK